MFTPSGAGAFGVRLFGAAALTAGLVLSAGTAAAAAPGDNGTVKIHNPETPDEDNRNEPKVCEFKVVAFGFDAGQEVSWEILTHGGPPNSRTVELEGELVLDEDGAGSTELLNLDNGHYKLEWSFEGQKGKGGKHKVFKVDCPEEDGETEPTPTPEPSPTPTDEPETETPDTPENPENPDTPDEGKTPDEETDLPEGGSEEEPEPTTPVTEAGPGGEKDGSDLAVTGSALVGLVAAGALAAAGGGAALYMSRKRRGGAADTEV